MSSDQNWTCSLCGNDNYPTRMCCNRRSCGVPRERAEKGINQGNRDGGDRGDSEWNCMHCGNSNYSTRTHCNMRKCGRPRNGPNNNAPGDDMSGFGPFGFGYPYGLGGLGAPAPDAMGRPMGGGNMGGMGPMGHMGGMGPMGGMGGMGGGMMGGMGGPQGMGAPPMGGKRSRDARDGLSWKCPGCDNDNYSTRTHCNMRKCGKPRPEATKTWNCEKCGNENFPERTHCNMRKCKHPREATVTEGDVDKRQKLEDDSTAVSSEEPAVSTVNGN